MGSPAGNESGDAEEYDGKDEQTSQATYAGTHGYPRTYCDSRRDLCEVNSGLCWTVRSGSYGARIGHHEVVSGGHHVEANSEHHERAKSEHLEANFVRCEQANNARNDQAIAVVVYDCPHVECQESSHVFLPGDYF